MIICYCFPFIVSASPFVLFIYWVILLLDSMKGVSKTTVGWSRRATAVSVINSLCCRATSGKPTINTTPFAELNLNHLRSSRPTCMFMHHTLPSYLQYTVGRAPELSGSEEKQEDNQRQDPKQYKERNNNRQTNSLTQTSQQNCRKSR